MTQPEFHTDRISTDDALRRAQRLVNRQFAAIFALLLIIAALGLSLRYVEAINEGRREAANFADLLSEYLTIRLRGIDGALSRIAADSRRIGGPEGSEREWAAAMRSAIAGVTGLSALVILDADGVVQHATVQQIRGLSWADRQIFQELARGVPNLVAVDPPVTMVAGNQVLVPFGRALTDPRGDFIGVIVAMLLPNQLRDFLGTFDLGQSGIAWVLLPSGEVLFRDGAVDALADATTETEFERPLFASNGAVGGDGIVTGPLFPGGPTYLTAYRETAIADLVVAVSIANQGILSRWKYEIAGTLIIVLVIGALLYFAARRINAAALDIVATADAELLEAHSIASTPAVE